MFRLTPYNYQPPTTTKEVTLLDIPVTEETEDNHENSGKEWWD